MHPRSWFLFLVAIGCAWTIGYFMGSPGPGGSQNVIAAEGERTRGPSASEAGITSGTGGAAAADAGSKSIYSFAERMRGISSHPSARWRNAHFARLAEDVAIADIPRVVEELKLPFGTDGTEMTRMLFARWAEADPRGALEFARRSKNYYGISTALGEWAAVDPSAAIAWLNEQPPGPDRDSILPGIFPALARVDPARAFQLMKENPRETSGGYHLSEVIGRWVSKDLTAAVAAVEGLSQGTTQYNASTALASAWGRLDPQAALSWALKIPDRNMRRWVVGAAIQSFETLDIEAVTAKANALPDERDRSAVLASLVGVAAKRDPEKAFALLGEIATTEMRESATTSMIYAIMSTDIDRAAKLAETLAGRMAEQPMKEVVERLKFTDPERAAVLSLKTTQSDNRAIGSVLGTWMRSSPEAALGWLEKTKLPANLTWSAQESLSSWAGENFDAATTLVRDRSGAENLKWVLSAAIQGISTKDPKAAAELLDATPGVSAPMTLGAIGSNWARKDPQAGAQWVARLPDTQNHRSAAWGFTNAWAAADPKAAAAWIDGLQAGAIRDGATAAFSAVTASTDPEGALHWASTMQHEGQRNDAMNQVLRTWAEREPAAVKKWVAGQPNLPRAVLSNLPE